MVEAVRCDPERMRKADEVPTSVHDQSIYV